MTKGVKGFLLADLIRVLQQEQNDGLAQLSKYYKGPVNFDPLSDYPTTISGPLIDGIILVKFGKVDDKGFEWIGEKIWEVIAHSHFGKALMNLFGTNFHEIGQQIPKFYELLGPLGEYIFTPISKNSFTIRFVDDPTPQALHKGIFKGIARQYKTSAQVKTKVIDIRTFDLEVSW